ncbi:MAG TPA: isocitrate lyase/phosphoenolpyruvate mutase family protein [Acidimicrobiia bacterium]|nr:isocitrate lyase/phosphoenolpyruvate mutase family protein [Acidimicrobiia bacterium]
MTDEAARLVRLRERFMDLHRGGTFLMPNAWDIGSAKILATLGFPAIATTSSGFGASLGRMDQQVTPGELAAHVRAMVSAVEVPVSVDAENGYAATPAGVAATVDRLAAEGAAGVSIEDYDPGSGLYPLDEAIERVAAAVEVAQGHRVVLTARAENHLYDVDDIEDTITRLCAYREAGADVLYAPGLEDAGLIARVVAEVKAPINVLLLRSGPTVNQLAELGVRRLSTGGSLTFAAYGALATAARELLTSGTSTYSEGILSNNDRQAAFGERAVET